MSVHLTSVKSTETSATYHTQLTHHINLHTPLPCVMQQASWPWFSN